MLTSMEMRWFDRGTIPGDVEHWFSVDCPGERLGKPDDREDVYLYTTPMCEYLNIKLRQGRLEVKWRKAELGVLQLGNLYEGKAEKWIKWFCEDPTTDNMTPEAVVGQGSWISVKKRRFQRMYNIFPGTSITLLPVNQPIHKSCAVEITQLNIRGNDWWSLAFEAFGEEATLMDKLQQTAQVLFKTYRGPNLQAKNSFAYPKWLSLEV